MRVVAGAIISAGRVLVALRRPGQPRGGCWELPGGKVETAETDAAALRRELAEELGVEVAVHECLGESRHDYGDVAIHLLAYRCVLSSGVPVAREHAAVTWATADQLHGLSWAEADRAFVSRLQRVLTGDRSTR